MYIDVLLPLYIPQMFTYCVPQELQSQIVIGARVSVTVGKNKLYSAIVYNIRENAPSKELTYRPINSIIDSEPILTEHQLKLWEWISQYYMCSLGEVMKCFIPKELKLTASISDKNRIEYNKNSSVVTVKYITVLERDVSVIDSKLSRSKRQKEAYSMIMEQCEKGEPIEYNALLSEHTTTNTLKELVRKKIIEIERFEQITSYKKQRQSIVHHSKLPQLSPKQTECYQSIHALLVNKRPTLLYGVSGSGKTEIYLNVIKDVVESGRSALILIPEIALATHLTTRVDDYFGEMATLYTSIQTDTQRYKSYYKILNGEVKVVIGTRIAIGLPFRDLEIIVVDEEHESSYKQNEPTPRFNARDSAVMLGAICGANVLLVSSTPSIESYYNAQNGKYNLVEIDKSFVEKNRGKITVIDKRAIAPEETKRERNATENRYFSNYLRSRIEETISGRQQTILFKNNRGFANYIECRNCGEIPRCNHCNITLNYHHKSNRMVCHLCSESVQKSNHCLVCGSNDLVMKGYGTENIEERVLETISNTSVVRIDSDTVKSKKTLKEALTKIEEMQVNVIVGTQIICKGFDFQNVSLVAIVDADSMLNQANFRAEERAFQTFIQLFGRTTRTLKKGEMILQSSNPNSEIVGNIRDMNYNALYAREIQSRHEFRYPPFVRLLCITIKHNDKESLRIACEVLCKRISKLVGKESVAVNIPFVDRVRELYITKIIVKLNPDNSLSTKKEEIRQELDHFLKEPLFKGYTIGIDVDPQN